MESSSQLKKELAEQAAAAKTLELDLQAQRDVSYGCSWEYNTITEALFLSQPNSPFFITELNFITFIQ